MTDAIPYGVYRAPLSILRDTVRACLTSNEQHCYVQLINRLSTQSYAIYASASFDDLLDLAHCDHDPDDLMLAEQVIVTTISRQDLHQSCSLIAAPRAAEPLYVASAAILRGLCTEHDDSLLALASSAWLCYFRILRLHSDGSAHVLVSALPHRLTCQRSGLIYETTLSSEALAQALPLDRRMLALATADLRELVEEHAQAVTGRTVEHPRLVPERDKDEVEQTTPARSYPPEVMAMLRLVEVPESVEQDEQQTEPEQRPQETRSSERIYVSTELLASTYTRFIQVTKKQPTSRKLIQKVVLQATLLALQALLSRLKSVKEREATITLEYQIRCVLVNHLRSSTVQLVHIEPEQAPGMQDDKEATLRGCFVRVELPLAA